jgi:hypothetical protein
MRTHPESLLAGYEHTNKLTNSQAEYNAVPNLGTAIKNCIRVVNIQQVLKFILNLVSSLTFGIIYHL